MTPTPKGPRRHPIICTPESFSLTVSGKFKIEKPTCLSQRLRGL